MNPPVPWEAVVPSTVWAWLRKWTTALPIDPERAARLTLGTFYRETRSTLLIPVPVWSIADWLGIGAIITVEGRPGQVSVTPGEIRPALTLLRGHGEDPLERFSAAHTIGHVLMHPHGCYDHPGAVRDPDQEKQATEFALSLLLPRDWVTADVWTYDTDESRVAGKFKVPQFVADYRLKTLGLVP